MLTSFAQEVRSQLQAGVRAVTPTPQGTVSQVLGLAIGVQGLRAGVGEMVAIHRHRAASVPLYGQVVGLTDEGVTCMPLGTTDGVGVGDPVRVVAESVRIPAGYGMLGRIVDALGQPMDSAQPLDNVRRVALDAASPNPLHRRRVDTQLTTGVRALDSMVPLGAGQRLGIMAGSGVGKSTLLGMTVKGTNAPIRVVALVGERGREVREFLEDTLDAASRANTVIIVATADDPPLLRLTAAFTATRIAEFFRDEGHDVLLVVDSITRTALAQREVALAAGEPPATRGYPASVFAMLPRLLERSGPGANGSITALYTVLIEGDDLQDPIGDAVRGIVDGHVVLSRKLATAAHFPSIDVLESVSRVDRAILDPQRHQLGALTRRLMAAYRDARDLIEVGAYAAGSDSDVDLAITLKPQLDRFLQQDVSDCSSLESTWAALEELWLSAGGAS